jgi:hypothetical protein
MDERRYGAPATLERPEDRDRDIWAAPRARALGVSGDRERMHPAAGSGLRYAYRRQGGHWVPNDQPAPAHEQAAHGSTAPESTAERTPNTDGGAADGGMTRKQLYERATKLGIRGRSRMNKKELAIAVHDADAGG